MNWQNVIKTLALVATIWAIGYTMSFGPNWWRACLILTYAIACSVVIATDWSKP